MKILCARWLLTGLVATALGCTDDDPLRTHCFTSSASGELTCRDDLGDDDDDRTWSDPRGDDAPWGPRDAGTFTDLVPPGSASRDAGVGTPPPTAACASKSLDFRPIDVEYASSLDRIVAVSANPNVLSLLDPVTHTIQAVPLPLAPAAVSVAPDGRTAAVGHDAYVSIVDLAQASVQATIATTVRAYDVVLAGNGYAYVFPQDDYGGVHSIDVASRTDRGAPTHNTLLARRTKARLHPSGAHIYGISGADSSGDLSRYDLMGSAVPTGTRAPFDNSYQRSCGDVWFTAAGERILTGCGTVFRSSPGANDDFAYAGVLGTGEASPMERLYGGPMYRWITSSPATHKLYAVPAGRTASLDGTPTMAIEETRIHVYSEEFLQHETALNVPCLDSPVGKQHVLGRYVFVDVTGKRLYLVGQLPTGSSAAKDWASAVIAL